METESCPKGGMHIWGTDGQHSNEFCKKCFTPSPNELKIRELRAKQYLIEKANDGVIR